MRAIRVGLAIIGVVVAIGVVGGQGRVEPLSIVMSARAVQPGEVVRLDIAGAASAAVTARVFDHDAAIIPVGPGRWRVLVGVDLDVAAGPYPVRFEVTEEGRTREQAYVLTVEPKTFPERRLKVDPKFVEPPASMRPRIERERARLAAVFGSSDDTVLWRGPFALPVDTAVISNFGKRSIFNGVARAPHSGADLAGKTGTPVTAPNAGRVRIAANLYFTGNTVVIDHGAGLFSLLAHLSRIDVKEGEAVTRGLRVGAVGATGRVTGPHLHWSVRLGAARVDPISLIAALADVAEAGSAGPSRR